MTARLPSRRARGFTLLEVMLAIVLLDHSLRHRAQNADVRSATPDIGRRPKGG